MLVGTIRWGKQKETLTATYKAIMRSMLIPYYGCCCRPTPPACSCGGVRQPNFSREALPGVSST